MQDKMLRRAEMNYPMVRDTLINIGLETRIADYGSSGKPLNYLLQLDRLITGAFADFFDIALFHTILLLHDTYDAIVTIAGSYHNSHVLDALEEIGYQETARPFKQPDQSTSRDRIVGLSQEHFDLLTMPSQCFELPAPTTNWCTLI